MWAGVSAFWPSCFIFEQTRVNATANTRANFFSLILGIFAFRANLRPGSFVGILFASLEK